MMCQGPNAFYNQENSGICQLRVIWKFMESDFYASVHNKGVKTTDQRRG